MYTGTPQALVIPYATQQQRIMIIGKEKRKGNKTKYDSKFIYVTPEQSRKRIIENKYTDSGATRTYKNFRCPDCRSNFRVTALKDICFVICSTCGGKEVEELTSQESKEFEKRIN